jgi:hypothetical protein
MRRKRLNRSARRRALVDGAVAAYSQWRGECAAVRQAYRWWIAASAAEKPFAFAGYNAALDREERAARRYAVLMGRASHLPEVGLARQLAQIQVGSRAG